MDGFASGTMPADYAWRVMMMAGIGFWQIRLDGNDGPIMSVNDEFLALLGRTREDFPADFMEFLETCVHSEDQGKVSDVVCAPPAEFDMECRLLNARDKNWRWFRIQGEIGECDEDGRTLVLFGCIVDIHGARLDRQKVETQAEALREEQDRLDAIIDAGGLMVWDWNLVDDTAQVYGSLTPGDENERLVEGPAEEVWGRAIAPDEWRRVLEARDRCARGEVPYYDVEYPVQRPDGGTVWWYDRGRIMKRNADGRPVHLMGITVDVTRQKETDFALEENLLRREEVEQSANVGCWQWDLATDAISVNDVYLRRLGYAAESFPARTMSEWSDRLAAPEDRERVHEIFRSMIEGGQDRGQCILRMRHRDGHYVWVHAAARVTLRDLRGRAVRMMGVQTDISENRRAETEQAGTAATDARPEGPEEIDRRLWADMLSACPVTLTISADNVVLYASPLARETLGLRPGDHYLKILEAGELGRLRKALDESPDHKIEWTPVRVRMADGAWRDCLLSVIDTRYEGQPAAAAWLVDVTRLESADQRMRLMLDAVPLAVTFWDETTRPIDCNAFALALFKQPDKQSYIEHFYDLSPVRQPSGEFSVELAKHRIASALRDGRADFRWLHRLLDGTPIPCEITLRAIAFRDHKVVVGVCRDMREITARRAQTALAQARTRNLLDAMPSAVIVFDADGNPVEGNTAAAGLFGLDDTKELLAHFGELSPPRQPDGRTSPEALRAWLERARQEGCADLVWTHRRLDGGNVRVHVALKAMTEYGNTEVAAFLSKDDVPGGATPS